ncbi:MAG TPA: DUF3300 domain-containing protein [Bryobacteraceae bacterium]|nr:DUF3300 domain-containing protein [Bryobacteraceae bacterium]
MLTISAKRAFGMVVTVALLFMPAARAQNPPPVSPVPGNPTPGQSLSPQQLDDIVAPIALYPDPLVGEVLAAATYPLEIVEAQQWVNDHPKWKPSKLMDEAKKQNWDPSVQGLVAFPQALHLLSQDVTWTTALGNANLAQQNDVMQAIQRMRHQASSRGTLQSNPQETVTTQNQDGQSVIDIAPANPNVWYVPYYNPAFVWGPPVWGYYPPLLYPGVDVGFDWGPGIDLGLYFGGWGGWGWGGWGWAPNWYGGTILVNNSFFHRYGFHHFHGGDAFGNHVWEHDPGHRLGVPYPGRELAGRYAGRELGAGAGSRGFLGNNESRPAQHFGSPGFEQRPWTGDHSVFGGYHEGGATRMQSDHGFSSMGAGRTFGGGFHGGGGGGFRGGGGRR